MAGIYIHIPFCKQRCYYCDFHFTTSKKNEEAIIASIKKEINYRNEEYKGEISSIYFGGGTPSILEEGKIYELLNEVHKNFSISSNPEITLEANPDDITKDKLKEYSQAGINRFSIGIQSFHEKDLIFMNRAHNSKQALNSIPMIQDAGFDNITMDLIYGIPNQSIAEWEENLKIFAGLNVNHLSAYALTVEEKTPLNKLITSGKYPNVNDEKTFNDFKLLIEFVKSKGFEHYEISNFAKDGFYSKHNTSYWLGEEYLGFGPSAHSYNKVTRRWNHASNKIYLENIDNQNYFDYETLSNVDIFNELLLTGLRTKWGVSINELQNNIDSSFIEEFNVNLNELIKEGKIILDSDKIKIAEEYKFQSDGITSDLFIVK